MPVFISASMVMEAEVVVVVVLVLDYFPTPASGHPPTAFLPPPFTGSH